MLSTIEMGTSRTARPSWLKSQSSYKAYMPSMKLRTPEAATRVGGWQQADGPRQLTFGWLAEGGRSSCLSGAVPVLAALLRSADVALS